jgi:resolvase-like protein
MTQRLGNCVGIPNPLLATIFYLLPLLISDDDLFHACSFFRSCCSEYSLMDGVVREILEDPKCGPDGERERLALENVILQSLRTIEALVGEPGGNELRFRNALQARGLNYDQRVGFQRKRKRNKLGDRIRWLQKSRDSAAAHGKRKRRAPFTLFEAMEAQNLADTVLHTSLWFAAESKGRTGDDDELRFLLTHLFRGFRAKDWCSDKGLFGGETAIDLARVPGGLRKVVKKHEREWHLRDNGFSLVSASESELADDTDPHRKAMRGMISIFAELEKSALVLKLRAARQRAKTNRRDYKEGRKPFGTRPGEQETIARMVELRKPGTRL